MRGELFPLAVEENAAQVEHALGSPSAPVHAGAVEPHAHEVAHGARALDRPGRDVEIVATELVVAHAMAMLAEVLDDPFD